MQFVSATSKLRYSSCLVPTRISRLLSDDLFNIARRAILLVGQFSRERFCDTRRFALQRLALQKVVSWRSNPDKSFNPKSFLAKVGEGRSIGSYLKDKLIFSQGEPADAVFFRKLGFIDYNGEYDGGIAVHSSLLNAVLHEQPEIKT